MEKITFGSVCSGIEAASVAWNPLGWEAAWLSEIEPFPCALLAHHYPDVPNLGDMTKIAHLIRDGFAPAPDVFCGGTPCQAFSVAGLRNSLDDARGNLSLTFCEIANEIDTRRAATGLLPSVIFWENVPGVLSTKDNAFGCFLAGLAGEDDPLVPAGDRWTDAGCVHGPERTVAWRVLDAQYFGVAQRRRRVFVVASARNGFDPAAILFEFDGVRRDSAPRREAGQETAGTLASRTDGGGFPGTDEACSGYVQPVAKTICAGGHSNNPLDENLIPIALSVALRGREGGATAELGDEVAGCLRASTGGGDKPHVLAPLAFHVDAQPDQQRFDPHVSAALICSQKAGVAYAIQAGALRTNPASGPDGVGVQEHIAYTLEARAEVQAACITGDITRTLKDEGFDASEDGAGRGQPIVAAMRESGPGYWMQDEVAGTLRAEGENRPSRPSNVIAQAFQQSQSGVRLCDTSGTLRSSTAGGIHDHGVLAGMAVRRLTPRECERLQGFPDDYTLIPMPDRRSSRKEGDRRASPRMAADGPRYKALGNSWAVPNVRWIGERIDRAMRNGQA